MNRSVGQTDVADGTEGARPRASLHMMLCGAALVFAIGFGTSQYLGRGQAVQPTTPQAASTDLSDAELLTLFQRTDWNVDPPQVSEDLSAALERSELLRAEVLKRYQQETQPRAKANIGRLAQSFPEVASVAAGWAQQSNSASTRTDGFTLLIGLSPSAEIYRLTKEALENEKDPRVLAPATWALKYPDNVLDPAEVQKIVPRLHTLTKHPDENVRAASIQRLAEWDLSKQYIEQDVLRLATTDASKDTRIAAVGASSLASLSSNELKKAFLKLSSDHSVDSELRGVVLMQLDRFALTVDEYAAYRLIAKSLAQ